MHNSSKRTAPIHPPRQALSIVNGVALTKEQVDMIRVMQAREVQSVERLANTQSAITQKAYQQARARGINLITSQIDPDLDIANGISLAHQRNELERGTIIKVGRHWAIYSGLLSVGLCLALPILHGIAIAIFLGAIATLITY